MTLRPHKARWFELLTPRVELTLAMDTLARTGSVELEVHADGSLPLNLPDLQERLSEYRQLAQRYRPFWARYVVRPATIAGMPADVLDTAMEHLRGWVGAAAPLVRRLEARQAEQAELRLIADMLAVDVRDRLDYALLSAPGPSLAVRLFVLPPGYRLGSVPEKLLYCECRSRRHGYLLAAGLPADLEELRNEVAALKGRTLNLPGWLRGPREMALGQLRERLVEVRAEIDRLLGEIDALAAPHHLSTALADIGRLQWFLGNIEALPVSDNFAWVTGWTDDLEGRRLPRALAAMHVNAIVHYPPPPAELEPPLVLRNPWWARPFELFAGMLGTPAGDEVDPSRLLALLVPLLFGYMFGDVGQGAVLLLVGLLLKHRWPLLRILVANGASAMVFGFVFGSVFGREDVIPALWVHPVDQPLPVLAVPLAAGVLVLLLGLLLNALEAGWRGELRRWLRTDAAIVIMYLSLLAALFEPRALAVTGLACAGFLAGSLQGPRAGAVVRFALAAGGLVEKLMQLLLNTISFVRVGAFALAHAGLSLAFVSMAAATGNAIAAFLVMVLGNVVILLLEGLVVTIQTTRLVLFEFFIRFLQASGRTFRPLAAPEQVIATRE